MFKKLIFSSLALLAAVVSFAQVQVLPADPATRVGKLDNGLTYYIRHNANPANRADFYLATDAGALQEAPDQDGLAHFLEHMCFNGTKNFPGKGILDWLQSIGASFGGNVNASTGVEQTIYLLNNIPLVRPTVVDSCILVMHDYSNFVTCDPTEIDNERGVILEEKRTRNTASWRTTMNAFQALYKGTKYAEVSVIGSEENLKTFKPESLVNFYHSWYHPGNQALIVVGDIDVDEVEAKIRSIYSDIPLQENPAVWEPIAIPDNDEPIINIFTDPEITGISYEAYWKSEPLPKEYMNTSAAFINDLMKSIITQVMNERLSDISAKADAPFLNASFGFASTCKTLDVTVGSAACSAEKSLPGFAAMMTEVERMKRYGLSDAEVERAKNEILSQYEDSANKADTRKNSEFVMPLVNNFLNNNYYMDPAVELQLVQQILPQLNSAVLNQVAQQLITPNNLVVLYVGPEREGVKTPSEAEISAIIDSMSTMEIEQANGEEIPTEFLNPAKLKGSKVKSRKPYINGTELITLKNGLRIILNPSDLEKNQISFGLRMKGGLSLVEDADLASFNDDIFALFLNNSGVSSFSNTTVSKMLAGKQLGVQPSIALHTHGISGNSTPKDLETAMQLLYLYFTDPRFDEEEYDLGINQIMAALPNLEGTPEFAQMRELYKTFYGNSPRKTLISKEIVDKASLGAIERNYRKLFKDVAGAYMYVTGDFDKETIIPLLEKYAGSLPKGKKASDWSYRGGDLVSKTVTDDFRTAMQQPKVSYAAAFKYDAPYDVREALSISALSNILQMVYTETLREEEGGTYGAGTDGSAYQDPHSSYVFQVQFDTNEQQADKLIASAKKSLRDVAENGPDAEKFDMTMKNMKKNLEESKLRNGYWTSAINQYELYGIDMVKDYEPALDEITPAMIQDVARKLLNGNLLEVIMRPTK